MSEIKLPNNLVRAIIIMLGAMYMNDRKNFDIIVEYINDPERLVKEYKKFERKIQRIQKMMDERKAGS